MAQEEQIIYYATLCEQLYNPKSPNEREQVQKLLEYSFPTFADEAGNGIASALAKPAELENCPLFTIVTPTDTASALRILLENSPNPYVQTFCLSRLKQLVSSQFSIFSTDTKLQLRSFLLEYAFMHPDLQPFIVSQMASILTLLTRLGWLEVEEYQDIRTDINQFLQSSMDHRIVGMQLLAGIIHDMNATSAPRNTANFRKAAAGFRDSQLLGFFELAIDIFNNLTLRSFLFEQGSLQHSCRVKRRETNVHVIALADQENKMKDATLKVLIECLSYDFTGTNLDEAGEDIGTVQIPASWRPIYERENFVDTFFRAYREFSQPHTAQVLECLVLIASTRKGLFSSDAERSKFVSRMMQGIRDIIITSEGMADTDNYNEFCRLLYRFRAAAPLTEITEKAGYAEWIELIAQFTVKAFQAWKWGLNTAPYLLGFWSRIAQTMAYYQQLGEKNILKLEHISVEITHAYLTANVEAVPVRIEEMLDDPLENEDALIESMMMLGQIARCNYQDSSQTLIAILEPVAIQYQEVINRANSSLISDEELRSTVEILETQFTWLVYAIATFMGNRPAFLSADDLDAIDGELATKVLQLMDVYQALQNRPNLDFLNAKLDIAFIYFFEQFRKSYIGDSGSNAVYNSLTEVYGIRDQGLMLEIIMRKIVNNLQIWRHDVHVIYRTLQLFNELASGFSALRNIRKLQTTQLVLQNHMSSDFAFAGNEKHRQNRMLYYEVLCKILFTDDNCQREFYEFMRPFDLRLQPLLLLNSADAFRQESVRITLQDVFRDLRGFLSAIQTRQNFLLFFEWFYPEYMPIVFRALEAWSPNPIANVLLRFFAEFVQNKNQRLHFEISSPNGILIFRDMSQIISTYGRHVLEQTIEADNQKYAYKYKGISICFSTFGRCLGGRYINFGVFWLYGDKAINEAFDIVFRMMLSIPIDDLMGFPKLTRSFFSMMDYLVHEQFTELPSLAVETFLYIMQACEQGVQSEETWIRSHACSIINHICTYVIQETEKIDLMRRASTSSDASEVSTASRRSSTSSPGSHWLLGYLSQYPQVLLTLFTSIFGLVLFEETIDPWQLSRPLYALMLLQKDRVVEYTTEVINRQLPERREFLTTALNNLMEGINWTLSSRDRERFSQNVSAFRRKLSASNIALLPYTFS
ncbi:armadillo-type protein [Radiomyces spectabilis]|uniref:armadillo-type protein n=1 Tax=Radiomyces spectabilis TaxID=64574 RepID=UPI002220982F|nr:armadillo-type protein [Radiomyces spectabilis]KAI8388848.1 armadillo-type protein [Radiomyces spectabilis]